MFLKKIKTILKIYLDKFLPDKRNFIFKIIKKNSICCEIGVWKGVFSEIIIKKNNPKKLYLIDPWKDFGSDYFKKKHEKYLQKNQDDRFFLVQKKLAKYIESKQVEIFRMTSKEAFEKIRNVGFDFIYIDGNHEYEFVKFDIEKYFELLNSGGYLAGDDYRLPSIQKAVKELVKEKNIKNLIIKNDQFILRKN
tara:strand:+ start:285 stop:863 length:579 start_codon:yes stop_codon:yes gene_type:complete